MGPRDVEQGTCVAARRDVRGKEGKQMGVPLEPQAFVAYAQARAGLVGGLVAAPGALQHRPAEAVQAKQSKAGK